jgi:hypothetical protein
MILLWNYQKDIVFDKKKKMGTYPSKPETEKPKGSSTVEEIKNPFVMENVQKEESSSNVNTQREEIPRNRVHDFREAKASSSQREEHNEGIQDEPSKLELIVKPCQSGKTFVMIQELIQNFADYTSENWIHLIFTDNSILQTQQLQKRLDTDETMNECIENIHSNCIVLSSESRVKKLPDLIRSIESQYHRNIIAPANKTRIVQLDACMQQLTQYRYSIWIDEADKTFTSERNIEYIQKWLLRENVMKITFITATPLRLFQDYQHMKIYAMQNTYMENAYQRLEDCDCIIENFPEEDTFPYLQSVIEKHKSSLQNGQCWFVPGDFTKHSHELIKDFLIKKRISVILINGDHKSVYIVEKNDKNRWICNEITIRDDIRTPEELAVVCGNIYERYHLHEKIVAITGNICISRGITISSPKMMITHAIIPPSSSTDCALYQLAGRVCGNIKEFPNYRRPVVFMKEKTQKCLYEMEKRAIQLAKIAYEHEERTGECYMTNEKNYMHCHFSRIFHFYTQEFVKGEENQLKELIRKNKFKIQIEKKRKDESGKFYLSSTSGPLKVLTCDEIKHALNYNPYGRLDITEEDCKNYPIGKKKARLYIGYRNKEDPNSVVYFLLVGEVISILSS